MKHVIREDIYSIVKPAVVEGLEVVRRVEAEQKFIPRYYYFPKLQYFQSGLPQFTTEKDIDCPYDFGSVFRDEDHPNKLNLISWKRFWQTVIDDESISKYWEISDADIDKRNDVFRSSKLMELTREIFIYGAIAKLVDRYIHLTNSKEFNEEQFLPIYAEWERPLFSKKLICDLVVPIICQNLSCGKVEVAEGIIIECMDEGLQKARSQQIGQPITVSTHRVVVGAATHAIVFQNLEVNNSCYEENRNILFNLSAFSQQIERINLFFAAYRTEIKEPTGYSQIIIRPTGWFDQMGLTANLPNIYVLDVRAYPDKLEQYGWLTQREPVDEEMLMRVGRIYEKLVKATNKTSKIGIAVKRLNNAYLRSDEDDSILDIAIGLESLLVADKAELVHKLSLRLAALSKLLPFRDLSAEEVLFLCKRLYDYRSKVVHGVNQGKVGHIIRGSQNREFSAIDLGVDLLTYTIKVLVDHPHLLADPQEIDKLLLK